MYAHIDNAECFCHLKCGVDLLIHQYIEHFHKGFSLNIKTSYVWCFEKKKVSIVEQSMFDPCEFEAIIVKLCYL